MPSYRSCLKIKIPWNLDVYFTKETNPSVEDFDVQVIAQLKIFHVKNNLKSSGKLHYELQIKFYQWIRRKP